jgi:hypothetical protein
MNFRNSMHLFALAIAPVIFLASCASQPDRVLMRRHATQDYCHMKVETRGDPSMPTEREVVDYYGHCDDRPSPRR